MIKITDILNMVNPCCDNMKKELELGIGMGIERTLRCGSCRLEVTIPGRDIRILVDKWNEEVKEHLEVIK